MTRLGYTLAASSMLLLTACDSGDDTPSQQELYQEYLAEHSGFYQGTMESEGEVTLYQLAMNATSATLIINDSRGQKTGYSSSFDATSEELHFAENILCQSAGELFSCEIGDELLQLSFAQQEAQPVPTSLAGSYQIHVEDQITTISVDESGHFVTQLNGCTIEGIFTQTSYELAVQEVTNNCNAELASGLALSHSLYTEGDTLEVIMPGSSLSGFWTP